MRNVRVVSALLGVLGQILLVLTPTPAGAIDADLAKKCRDMAIKAHPPPMVLGGKPYAQAERDFYKQCVANNGQMPNSTPPKAPAPADRGK